MWHFPINTDLRGFDLPTSANLCEVISADLCHLKMAESSQARAHSGADWGYPEFGPQTLAIG